ncbi:unnamed protein product, partial [Symbiodinium sp. KB8]
MATTGASLAFPSPAEARKVPAESRTHSGSAERFCGSAAEKSCRHHLPIQAKHRDTAATRAGRMRECGFQKRADEFDIRTTFESLRDCVAAGDCVAPGKEGRAATGLPANRTHAKTTDAVSAASAVLVPLHARSWQRAKPGAANRRVDEALVESVFGGDAARGGEMRLERALVTGTGGVAASLGK